MIIHKTAQRQRNKEFKLQKVADSCYILPKFILIPFKAVKKIIFFYLTISLHFDYNYFF